MQLYQLKFPNGKSYIGITSKTAQERLKEHFRPSQNRNACQRAIHKYGKENVVLVVLATVDNWELLCLAEMEAIEKFNTFTPNGYNMTLGGDGSHRVPIYGEERIARDKLLYSESKRKYHKKNKEKLDFFHRLWIENNKERYLQKKQLYNIENKEKIRAQKIAYYHANKEKLDTAAKKWRESNREYLRNKQIDYRKKNKEDIDRRAKLSRDKNRDTINKRQQDKRKQKKEMDLILGLVKPKVKKVISEETRRKISEAHKGRVVTQETREKIRKNSLLQWEKIRKEKEIGRG